VIDLFGPVSEAFAATSSRVAFKDNGDVVSVHLRFACGPTAYINATLATPLFDCLGVYGSDARFEVINHTHPDTPGPATLTLQHSDGRVRREFHWTNTVGENLELFARTIDGMAEYIFTGAQKIANIAALEAICRSAAQNQPMAVAPPT
jgi:predicted dehydrogenase